MPRRRVLRRVRLEAGCTTCHRQGFWADHSQGPARASERVRRLGLERQVPARQAHREAASCQDADQKMFTREVMVGLVLTWLFVRPARLRPARIRPQNRLRRGHGQHRRNSRAVATRYDKRAYVFHGTVAVASIRLWLKT